MVKHSIKLVYSKKSRRTFFAFRSIIPPAEVATVEQENIIFMLRRSSNVDMSFSNLLRIFCLTQLTRIIFLCFIFRAALYSLKFCSSFFTIKYLFAALARVSALNLLPFCSSNFFINFSFLSLTMDHLTLYAIVWRTLSRSNCFLFSAAASCLCSNEITGLFY
jgi:hypothetical protein